MLAYLLLCLALVAQFDACPINERSKRQITKMYPLWPGGTVPYSYLPNTAKSNIDDVEAAIKYISENTCIKFERNADCKMNCLQITDANGCHGEIGIARYVASKFSYNGATCEGVNSAIHEFMHTLGIYHEHQRSDRDGFITVAMNKIPTGPAMVPQYSQQWHTHNYSPFEYGSIMMYSVEKSFNAIQPLDQKWKETLGNRRTPTFYDISRINRAYYCHDTRYFCKLASPLNCKNGGYMNPGTCDKCICPRGFGGKLCDDKPSEKTTPLKASTSFQPATVDFKNVNSPYSYIWITAPPNKYIEVRVKDIKISETNDDTCSKGSVEVKYMDDPRITNPIQCTATNKILKSVRNPLIIELYQRNAGTSSVTIEYRHSSDSFKTNLTTNGYDTDFKYQSSGN